MKRLKKIKFINLMSNTKFPSLYNIIRSDDIKTLTHFFESNISFDPNQHLAAGKKLRLLTQAVISQSSECINYLLNIIPPKSLSNYVEVFVDSIKYDLENATYYQSYYDKVMEYIYDNKINIDYNSEYFDILSDILIMMICKSRRIRIPDKYINAILYNNIFGFVERINYPKYRHSFESHIIDCKSHIIQIFIKYYNENNIDLSTLYLSYLTRSHNKSNTTTKLFKSLDVTKKVHFTYYDFNYRRNELKNTDEEYSISTIEYFYGEISNIHKIMENNNFEIELLNIFKIMVEDKFNIRRSIFFNNIISYSQKDPYKHVLSNMMLCAVDIKHLDLVKTKLTSVFWDWLRNLNNKCTDSVYKKDIDNKINELSSQ